MEWPGDFPEDHSFLDLVVPGISADLDFENLLKDTEDKLKLNAYSIEQQLLELQSKLGDSRSGERPPSPAECLQWFNLRNSLRPVATKPQDIMDFLRAMLQYLGSEEDGKEKLTLQLLLDLSTQCGICFPNGPSSTFLASTLPSQLAASSMNLVHTVKDDSSVEIQEAWDNVRFLLRRHLMNQLSTNHCQKNVDLPASSSPSLSERAHCLQQLCFLYPETEVLALYQEIRRQLVLSTLNTVISSSSCGNTGFDRLTKGFSSVVGILIRAVTEDLHVLTRRVELHRTLAFLNAAYFGTLTCELASLIERESETALRDNTMVGSKMKKYTSMSRATVAPLEPPMKSRSFSLTAHQLKALTQMTCTLMNFESDIQELVSSMTFVDCTGESPSVKGILKKSKEESETAGNGKRSATETPLHSSEEPVLEYEWRSAFKVLAPHMAHCVKVVLNDICAKSLQQEQMVHSDQCGFIDLSEVSGHTDFIPGNAYLSSPRDTPKRIAQFCATILDEADALLPLAIACKDGCLLEVQSSFVEAFGRVAFDILGRLEERALDIPSSAPLKNLASVLATCIYTQQRLEYYHSRLKGLTPKVPLTLLPIQKYQDTVKAIRDQLTGYCFHVCATCVLQDAESHYWADPKPFYEGERCSFSVQMWFYFLCGLRSDLWATLPAALAKELLGQVMSETLMLLVQRYARAQPSFKRQLQIRCDITALLMYVEQLMWSVCDSLEVLLDADSSSSADITTGGTNWPSQIHSLCDQLLTILVIHTSPLSLLHMQVTFVNNLTKKCGQELLHQPQVRWLNAVNYEFSSERSMEDGRRGEVASLCQLRLLTSDPANNPRLLLKILLDNECYLPNILLENSGFCQNWDPTWSDENGKAGDDFIVALFNIFICLNKYPRALTQALQLYLEKTQAWEHLYTLADSGEMVPVIVRCIRPVVMTSTDILLKKLVAMVMSWQVKDEPKSTTFKKDVADYVLCKVPKEWNVTHLEKKDSKTVIPNAIQALSFIFTNLPLVVCSLPSPIRYLFQVAEKQLSHHSRQLRSVGLLLWALLNCLIRGLEDPHALEKISGLSLDCKAKDRLALLAECLQASMGIQLKGVPKPTVHKVLQTLEEKRPKWISMQLQKSRKLCSDSVFERAKESGVAAAELTEQEMCLMLLEVCHQTGGSDYLRQIYHIIQGNEEFLISKLGGATGPSTLVNFKNGATRNKDAEKTSHFNPLCQVDTIGSQKLEQSAVVDWVWDWPGLLPAYQGMNPVTFKSLLANRWEMQDGAELRDEEKALVEELRRAYFTCQCGSGEQDPPDTDETVPEQTLGAAASSDKSGVV
ncbi:uncharacterized protein KIAA0825 homolog [Neosynchiropus ocellatus]